MCGGGGSGGGPGPEGGCGGRACCSDVNLISSCVGSGDDAERGGHLRQEVEVGCRRDEGRARQVVIEAVLDHLGPSVARVLLRQVRLFDDAVLVLKEVGLPQTSRASSGISEPVLR